MQILAIAPFSSHLPLNANYNASSSLDYFAGTLAKANLVQKSGSQPSFTASHSYPLISNLVEPRIMFEESV